MPELVDLKITLKEESDVEFVLVTLPKLKYLNSVLIEPLEPDV